jgi:hypothetical protein
MVFEPLLELPNAVTGVWKRFGVHLFEGRLTVEDMRLLETRGDAWHRRNPGRQVEMVVIFPSSNHMTSEERARMTRLIKRWEGARSASATVILATGITGASQRSVLTGFLLLAPPPHPTEVFGRTADAVSWLAPYVAELCGSEATPLALNAAVNALTTRFRSARAER